MKSYSNFRGIWKSRNTRYNLGNNVGSDNRALKIYYRGEPIPGVGVAWSRHLCLFSGMQLRNRLLYSGADPSESANLPQNLFSSTLHNQKLLIKKTQIKPKLVNF